MPSMQTVTETRHANLLSLIEKAGSVQAFANLVERSHSQISQLKNRSKHSKTGEPREVGDDMARHIEAKLSLPVGWMDVPPGAPDGQPAGSPAEAQVARAQSPGDALMMVATSVRGLFPEQREQIAQLATMLIKNGPSAALAAAVDDIAKTVKPARQELGAAQAGKAEALLAYAQQAMASMSPDERRAFAEVATGLGLAEAATSGQAVAAPPPKVRPRAPR